MQERKTSGRPQSKTHSRPYGGGRSSSSSGGYRPGGRSGAGDERGGSYHGGGEGGERGGRFLRKKINRFYTVFADAAAGVDYKDTERLSKFLTEKGKIIPRRMSGFTAQQQRLLARAIKRARHAGLLPFQAD